MIAMCLKMGLPVKVRHRARVPKRVLSMTHPSRRPRRRIAIRCRPEAAVLRGLPLRALLAPCPVLVERRRRAAELRAPAAEARCRTASGGTGEVRSVRVVMRYLGLVKMEYIAIVAVPLVWGAQNGICLADFVEALGGLWVVRVAIWMGEFG